MKSSLCFASNVVSGTCCSAAVAHSRDSFGRKCAISWTTLAIVSRRNEGLDTSVWKMAFQNVRPRACVPRPHGPADCACRKGQTSSRLRSLWHSPWMNLRVACSASRCSKLVYSDDTAHAHALSPKGVVNTTCGKRMLARSSISKYSVTMSGEFENASPEPKTWKVRVDKAAIISVSGCTNSGCRPKAETTVVTAYRMHDSGFFRNAFTAAVANGPR
mmetsp:Transcript_16869/g.24788  ORF Transcript_16869/g.24788 Transcript_16869/m.24788 type:complete len:217 (-) Transcript_16869:800-1450(-)